MEKRKFENKNRYIISIIIGTFIFLLIFAISYSISYFELQRVSNLQVGVGYDIFKDKLDYSLFNAPICDEESFDKISQDLSFQGRIIDDLEKKLGKQNGDVLLRKQFYALIEMEHFEFIKELNQKCGKKVDTIFFFYSNNDSELKESEEAGRILGVVYSRNENLIIYSFDVDLASNLVDKLENRYNITETPMIVINEKTKVGVNNILEIERHLS